MRYKNNKRVIKFMRTEIKTKFSFFILNSTHTQFVCILKIRNLDYDLKIEKIEIEIAKLSNNHTV